MPALAGSGETRAPLFTTTRWSLVHDAGGPSSPAARDALEALCRIYWPAIYTYLRRRGYDVADAQDLTQSFFQDLLQNETLSRAARARGRFRNFLLGALKLCLADEHARRATLKRGGKTHFVSLEELQGEELHQRDMIVHELSADEILEARWAGLLLDRALAQLRSESIAQDNADLFEALSPFLAGKQAGVSYDDVAARLDVGVGAVKSSIHRMRRRFALILRQEIMQTVSAPHELDDELRRLRDVFARALQQRT